MQESKKYEFVLSTNTTKGIFQLKFVEKEKKLLLL